MPTSEAAQFGSFQGLDNQRELMILFHRLGDRVSEKEGAQRRAAFLQQLIAKSKNGFAQSAARVPPCDCVQAYYVFVHICGVLQVSIDEAAKELEQAVMAIL